jgi:hypothetical protein
VTPSATSQNNVRVIRLIANLPFCRRFLRPPSTEALSSTGVTRLRRVCSRDTRPKHGVKSLTDGSRTFVYGKNDPFRSWPSSANELVEVTMGSETNV